MNSAGKALLADISCIHIEQWLVTQKGGKYVGLYSILIKEQDIFRDVITYG